MGMTGTFILNKSTYVRINEDNSQRAENIKVITLIKLTAQPM